MCQSYIVEVVRIMKIRIIVTLVEIISGLTASLTEPGNIILQITYFKAANNFKVVNKH